MVNDNEVETESQQTLMLDDVLRLNASSRLLAAKEKLDSMTLSLSKYPSEKVSMELLKHKKMLDEMVLREAEARQVLALGDVDSADSSWTHGSSFFGIHTHYKLTDEGSIMIRLEGEQDNLPLFEQLAVIHEVDLFHEWIPFCNASSCIEKIGSCEIVAYLSVNLPPITRDALIRAYGVDCMMEEGKILLIGGSIDDWNLQNTESGERIPLYPSNSTIRAPEMSHDSNPDLQKMPWKKSPGWFHDRMIVKDFKSIISIKGPNTAKIVILARINPKLALPQALINFVIKNVAGVFLSIFQRQVAKVEVNAESSHGLRIRENLAFYEHWLLPKIRHHCERNNWPQPVIKSLGILSPDVIPEESVLPILNPPSTLHIASGG